MLLSWAPPSPRSWEPPFHPPAPPCTRSPWADFGPMATGSSHGVAPSNVSGCGFLPVLESGRPAVPHCDCSGIPGCYSRFFLAPMVPPWCQSPWGSLPCQALSVETQPWVGLALSFLSFLSSFFFKHNSVWNTLQSSVSCTGGKWVVGSGWGLLSPLCQSSQGWLWDVVLER
jgi:hypothetical protein